MNKEIQMEAMKIAANELGVSEDTFAAMMINRILNDASVPEDLKKQMMADFKMDNNEIVR